MGFSGVHLEFGVLRLYYYSLLVSIATNERIIALNEQMSGQDNLGHT